MHAHLIPAVVAGIIEGIVEWLPVSSKTMITLYFAVSGVKIQNAYNLGLIANFGSFFAALYYFRREVVQVIASLRHPFSDSRDARLLRFIVVATLATGITGIPIYVLVQSTMSLVGGSVAMLGIGVLLFITALITRQKSRMENRAQDVSSADRPLSIPLALYTGGMQGIAALPGISRSAMTMTPLLLDGFSASEALRLSFMLDVIALVGAGIVPVLIGHGGMSAIHQFGVGMTLVMLVVAAIVSFAAIHAVLNVARRLKTWIVTLAIAIVTLIVPIVALIAH